MRQIFVYLFIFFSLYELFAGSEQRYWIFFSDKGSPDAGVRPAVSGFTLEKRQRKNIDLYTLSDLPVKQHYIEILKNSGITVYRRSRWLNAVSVYLQNTSAELIRSFPFVNGIQPVRRHRFQRNLPAGSDELQKYFSGEYGLSENQVQMIGIPVLHEQGFFGQGVRIALFDTGFRLTHESMRHINVIAAYDFINNDHNVDYETGDSPDQHHHGTRVLSVIGGHKPGMLIGPAYEAEYLLAKTDDLHTETHIDEDNWVAAMEWADSLGADIISSSLGYSTFDAGEGDYTYDDMDGQTTIVTRAANMAVEKGIAVFTSAGNEGAKPWYYITAPADGFNVIAVGGLNPDGSLWSGSSRGPTADGRIKPEVLAQAVAVYTADPVSLNKYSVAKGTSLACPLAAGSGALILSINPNLDPISLRELMITSADNYQTPDNNLGYGRVDLEAAFALLTAGPKVEISEFSVKPMEGRNQISWNVHMEIDNGQWSLQRRKTGNISEEIARFEGNVFSLHLRKFNFLDTQINGGESIQYILAAQPGGREFKYIDSVSVSNLEPKQNTLLSCYPNPFNMQTAVSIGLLQPAKVTLKIFDVNGRRVKTMVDAQNLDAGYHHYVWEGNNDNQIPVSSGMYFIFAWIGRDYKTQKVMLIK